MAGPTRSLAVVTGGGTGIGRAIAETLAERGIDLVLAARDLERLERVAHELRRRGVDVSCVSCDVTQPDSVAALVEHVIEQARGTQLELVVSNAGAVEVHGFTESLVDADGSADLENTVFERMLAVCHLGAVRVAEAFLPALVERRRGLLVQVASAAALRAFPGISGYAVAKHALLGWSSAAAVELAGKGVAIATLCPYYVQGDMLERAAAGIAADGGTSIAAARRGLAARNPSGKLVEPRAISESVATLLEAALLDPTQVNARVIVFDGGAPRSPDPALDRSAPDA